MIIFLNPYNYELKNKYFLCFIKENEFQKLQQNFLDKYWNIFEPNEENKLVYMDAFNDYVS